MSNYIRYLDKYLNVYLPLTLNNEKPPSFSKLCAVKSYWIIQNLQDNMNYCQPVIQILGDLNWHSYDQTFVITQMITELYKYET